MNFRRLMQGISESFDEEKTLEKKKAKLQKKIDRKKRIDKLKKDIESQRKELDNLENPGTDRK